MNHRSFKSLINKTCKGILRGDHLKGFNLSVALEFTIFFAKLLIWVYKDAKKKVKKTHLIQVG
ncbi:hypothetical protein CXF88_10420 [Shewanella sp. ALD9]|jgi:hypothetical protein|nr:hypothetical protein CXF88_10420 [Shewanella sp. ALD9]